MAANPFTYGNPVSEPARFFGRQREVEHVFNRLRNVEFESSSLVGERHIGKTSLLKHLTHPYVRREYGLDPDKYVFIYTDLQIVDEAMTPAYLWQWLLRQLSRHCRDTEIKLRVDQICTEETVDHFALLDLFAAIDGNGQCIVFLFDEFEYITKNSNFGSDFFSALRSLAIRNNLALITSSRRELNETIYSDDTRSSSLFNIFSSISIPLFTTHEVAQLISDSLATTPIYFSDAEFDVLSHLAGLQPFLLQAACYFLFEAYTLELGPQERRAYTQNRFRNDTGLSLASMGHSPATSVRSDHAGVAYTDRKRRSHGVKRRSGTATS